MPNPYAEIFRAPGAKAFSAAGFIARLPLAMVTLGIVTMLSQARGEYALAGAVSATFALSNALIAPQISRLVDRHGQGRVAIPATVVTVAALAGLMLATRLGAPDWTLYLFAVGAGAMPSMTALVRARWTELYRDTPQLRTAFAFESVVDEMIFMTGPILAIGLSVTVFPEAGPLAATLLLAVGVALFSRLKATEPPVHAAEAGRGRSVIRLGSIRVIGLTMVAVGAIFGTAEVTAVAFAEAHGHTAAASLVLAAYALGSLIVGLVFGAIRPRISLSAQFLLAIGLAALTTLPLLVVDSIPALALVLFLAGAAVSPTIITAMGLIERLAPPSQLTEGITWAMTGVGIGMAVGSSISGRVIDELGAASGFWVSVAGGATALAVALLGQRWLRERGTAARPAMA
ncbi:MFS transporter [Inquilinus limosus]|uniref:MFS transporter n=1 Tax=Inquilinus limosus TaxID=171674 RepID=UPI00041D2C12|nr:MFS transporter [Inquilinus limosus]